MGDKRDELLFTLYPYFNAVIDSAEGCTLTASDGRQYLDLASGQLSVLLGHSHPRIVAAAQRQAARVVHLGNRFFGTATLEAVDEIVSVCPAGMNRVILCSTGTEANEMAIRIARAATGKIELVGLSKGYYGCSHLTLSLSDYVGFIKGTGVRSTGVHRLPAPDCLHCSLGLKHPDCGLRCLALGAENLEKESTGSIAAFLAEPVLGSGGIIIPPEGYLKGVAALCKRYGALLIADEAQTGLCRTGRWWGMDHCGVVPDILVASKGLGNGYPVAAVITRADIEQKCINAPLANMSSHSFDPFGAAIAAEVVRTLKDENIAERSREMGAYMLERLEGLAARHRLLANARGCGLMLGLDVVGREGKPDAMTSLALEAECLMRGLVVGYSAMSGVLRILPPAVITREQVEHAVGVLDEATTFLEENDVDVSRYMPEHNGSALLAVSFLRRLMKK
ncbi:MAG: aspartate aminotransferase family protein [Deltaproteobacteria bacterium]|nr:aspartate aminotransferase family protein [Deltaproteobacteria bacterium]